MASLFESYFIIKDSGLFDEIYYRTANPDIAGLNIDPLMHYLERGASELRNPSRAFDARSYTQRCQERGERVGNPLLHYINGGAAHGLRSHPPKTDVADMPPAATTHKSVAVDLGSVGSGAKPKRGLNAAGSDLTGLGRPPMQLCVDSVEVDDDGILHVVGWAVCFAPITSVQVFIDDARFAAAEYGRVREDVAATHSQYPNARKSGFALHADITSYSGGDRLVKVQAIASTGISREMMLPLYLSSEPREPVPYRNDSKVQCFCDLIEITTGGRITIKGWAVSAAATERIEVLFNGNEIGHAEIGIERPDVGNLFPTFAHARRAGFSFQRAIPEVKEAEHLVILRHWADGDDTDILLPVLAVPGNTQTSEIDAVPKSESEDLLLSIDLPKMVEGTPDTEGPWSIRRRMRPAESDLTGRPLLGASSRPLFAIVLPLPRGPIALAKARATLASLGTQVYENWQLHILTRTPATVRGALLDGLDELSDRVKLLSGYRTLGRLFCAESLVSHLMVLRPGDELGCDALLEFAVHASRHPEADFLYADERRMSPSSGKVETFFKPQWSPDLLLSMNYLGRAWCARAEILRLAVIRPSELGQASSYHLALRLTERARAIRHVPATLLQAADAAESDASERKALQAALRRRGIAGAVNAGRAKGSHRVQRKVATQGLVSIIIPTCAARGLIRTCIESLRTLTTYRNFEIICIENIPTDKQDSKDWLRAHADAVIETATPFNWSRFNNLAVTASRGEFLLFLNDDIEIVDPAWLDALLEQAERREVGATGPQLLYPDRRVQHAGMFLAGLGIARHAFRYAAEDDPGYFNLALSQRDVIAVTGACLMTRRETFEALGGFDERHDVVNNDVDYCLRVRQYGLHTIYTPHTRLIHHELASRADMADSYNAGAFESKWRGTFVAGDPFFHPRLTKDRDDYSIEWEPTEVHCAGHPVMSRESIRRILIVKLDHIGDCVIALPAIRRLKHHFPAASLCVLTGHASKAVWELESAIDEVIEFEFFHARSSSGLVERTEDDWRGLRERLAPHRFDLAIDLRMHGETRSVLQYTNARYLAGFDTTGKYPWLDVAIEWSEDVALLRKRDHMTDALNNLVDAVAAASETDRATIVQAPAPLSRQALMRMPMARRMFCKRVVCVHPGVGNEMRQWPLQYFSLLIDQLIETEKVHVILIGGPDETELGARILDLTVYPGSVWSLIGCVSLDDLPALLARCSLFVGNNSGPQHIAAGLGIPTVGIHSGVADARGWGPMGPSAVAIHRAMTCAPCHRSKIEECNRELACLRGLLPADVMPVCQRLLAASPPPPRGGRTRRRFREHTTTIA